MMTSIEKAETILQCGGTCFGLSCTRTSNEEECPLWGTICSSSKAPTQICKAATKAYLDSLTKFTPKRGDRVLASCNTTFWSEVIFLADVGGKCSPYITVRAGDEAEYPDGRYTVTAFDNIKPLPAVKEMTLAEVCKELGYDIKLKKE